MYFDKIETKICDISKFLLFTAKEMDSDGIIHLETKVAALNFIFENIKNSKKVNF